MQRAEGSGPGGDAAFVATREQGVVDRVAQATTPRDGDVFGDRVALDATHQLLEP
ncbi:hypothetical protein [Streptomyces sp. NPDC048665]|uniref:hypothetical protein n=1 Tax=unclassified Streptomyces TaxID=2593676 RepID=UPI00343CE8A7